MERIKIDVVERKLGELCTRFSNLEFLTKMIVTSLISTTDNRGIILTSEMSFQNSIKALDALLRGPHEKFRERRRLNELIPKLNNVEQVRNRLVHSVYTPDENGFVVRIKSTAKLGKGHHFQEEVLTSQIFDDIIGEIEKLNKTLNQIFYASLTRDR